VYIRRFWEKRRHEKMKWEEFWYMLIVCGYKVHRVQGIGLSGKKFKENGK